MPEDAFEAHRPRVAGSPVHDTAQRDSRPLHSQLIAAPGVPGAPSLGHPVHGLGWEAGTGDVGKTWIAVVLSKNVIGLVGHVPAL